MSLARSGAALAVGAVLALVAGGCGPGSGSQTRLTEAADGSTVTLAVGDELVVALESNASTGYAWQVVTPLPEMLEQAGEARYVAPEDEDLVGAPGTEELTFDVVATGSGTLELVYVRSFEEPAEPAETVTVTVDVP